MWSHSRSTAAQSHRNSIRSVIAAEPLSTEAWSPAAAWTGAHREGNIRCTTAAVGVAALSTSTELHSSFWLSSVNPGNRLGCKKSGEYLPAYDDCCPFLSPCNRGSSLVCPLVVPDSAWTVAWKVRRWFWIRSTGNVTVKLSTIVVRGNITIPPLQDSFHRIGFQTAEIINPSAVPLLP